LRERVKVFLEQKESNKGTIIISRRVARYATARV
jgi:hypothetical protein